MLPRWVYTFRRSWLAVLCLFALVYWLWRTPRHHGQPTAAVLNEPANATLGFGRIYVVSTQDSKRIEALIQAANITGLDFDVPLQPIWTQEDINKFRIEDEFSVMTRGSIKSWLGHTSALQAFLASSDETALILEDDVDFDIRLLTQQVGPAALALRKLKEAAPNLDEGQFWPTTEFWDLLYIGHCGDYLTELDPTKPDLGTGMHTIAELIGDYRIYKDPTLVELNDLHPFTNALFKSFGVHNQERIWHRSKYPLCSFGYAVTRATAKRMVTDVMKPKEPSQHHNLYKSYDVFLAKACRERSLRCWTLQPELFHHVLDGESEIGAEDGLKLPGPVAEAGWEQVQERGENTNIGCGANCKEFTWFTKEGGENFGKLEWLREEVVGKGQCLKHRNGN